MKCSRNQSLRLLKKMKYLLHLILLDQKQYFKQYLIIKTNLKNTFHRNST